MDKIVAVIVIARATAGMALVGYVIFLVVRPWL